MKTFRERNLILTAAAALLALVAEPADAKTYAISGTVSGNVVAGVTIFVSGDANGSTTTDANGNYTFTGLSTGSYTVTPHKNEYTFLPISQSVMVSNRDIRGQNFTAIDAEWANWAIPPISPSNYSVNGNDTVTDNVTGLVWQQCAAGLSGSDCATGTVSFYFRFPYAPDAEIYCQSLNLGGWSTGWRLPSLIELESIVDYGTERPSIDATAFPNTPMSGYGFWASPPSMDWGFGGDYWIVEFQWGYTGTNGPNSYGYVRCVR